MMSRVLKFRNLLAERGVEKTPEEAAEIVKNYDIILNSANTGQLSLEVLNKLREDGWSTQDISDALKILKVINLIKKGL